jgi:hypothetical protein
MSEEMSKPGLEPTETVEENTDSSTEAEDKNAKLKSLPPDELVQVILDLRAENAKRRVEEKQREKELEEYRKWRDSQKSELEKLKEENATLKKLTTQAQKEKARIAVGKEAGLDPDLWEFIKGDTEEDMLASANKLASKAKKGSSPNDVFAGRRGGPVGDKPKDTKEMANDYLRQLIFGQG